MIMILLVAGSGFFVGSFLGVVIDRFGTNRSWWRGRSVCDTCHHVLGFLDLIPLVSFLFSGRVCRYCCTKLSLRYPLIEILTGFLFALVTWRYTVPNLFPIGYSPDHFIFFLFRDLFFTSLLLVLFFIDLRHMILPDSITVPGIILLFFLNISLGISWASLLIGMLLLGGFFAAQYVVSGGTWVGSGDIRFGMLLGAMFGWFEGLFALAIAYIIGAIFAIGLLLTKRVTRKTMIPFGPFLALSGYVLLFLGPFLFETFFWF